MGVKNNFSQAMSELIGISKNTEPEHKKELEEIQTSEVLETEEIPEEVVEEEEVKEESPQVSLHPKDRIMAILAAQQTQQTQPQPDVPLPPKPKYEGGVTTIARGTMIIGEIIADGDVELLGSLKGKIASQGDIKANGKVIGDLMGKDIELIACAVQGNIIASGLVTVDGDSVVVGDVTGENFCLDGKIKGNVTVDKEARFQPKAILAGNITTASIAMSQGAKIQGEVNIPLSEKETDLSFDFDMME